MAAILPKTSPYDYWTAAGSADFGRIPGGLVPTVLADTPIRLQRGSPTWGSVHIEIKHAQFLKQLGMSAPELVWRKCQQPGTVLTTEEDPKIKILLRMPPPVLLVLRYVTKQVPFFSVISVYATNNFLDGMVLGQLPGTAAQNVAIPQFHIPNPKPISVVVKKKKQLLGPGSK